jgi:tetratricopeptide (TPR) repeat protein
MADSLMAAGSYDDAITEYSRYLFFNPDEAAISDTYSKIGYCFAYTGQWVKAIGAVDKSVTLAGNDSLMSERRIDRAVILMASEEYGQATDWLKEETALSANESASGRAGMLLFVSHVLEHDWQAALGAYGTFVEPRYMESDSIASIIKKACNHRRKSPETALVLSTLVPGLGQIYAGRWLAGLDALALNAGLAYWVVSDLAGNRYTSGALVLFFLFRRYFSGNRMQAYESIISQNANIDDLYEKQILGLLFARLSSSDTVMPR